MTLLAGVSQHSASFRSNGKLVSDEALFEDGSRKAFAK